MAKCELIWLTQKAWGCIRKLRVKASNTSGRLCRAELSCFAERCGAALISQFSSVWLVWCIVSLQRETQQSPQRLSSAFDPMYLTNNLKHSENTGDAVFSWDSLIIFWLTGSNFFFSAHFLSLNQNAPSVKWSICSMSHRQAQSLSNRSLKPLSRINKLTRQTCVLVVKPQYPKAWVSANLQVCWVSSCGEQ